MPTGHRHSGDELLSLLNVFEGLLDHPANSGRAPSWELIATYRTLTAWLITARLKLKGGGCGPSPSSQRTPTHQHRPSKYLDEYIRCVHRTISSTDVSTMASLSQRRFSCIECPAQLTGFQNLKRHYFGRHCMVPSEERPLISDDVFGLNAGQLRQLRSEVVRTSFSSPPNMAYIRAGDIPRPVQLTKRAKAHRPPPAEGQLTPNSFYLRCIGNNKRASHSKHPKRDKADRGFAGDWCGSYVCGL